MLAYNVGLFFWQVTWKLINHFALFVSYIEFFFAGFRFAHFSYGPLTWSMSVRNRKLSLQLHVHVHFYWWLSVWRCELLTRWASGSETQKKNIIHHAYWLSYRNPLNYYKRPSCMLSTPSPPPPKRGMSLLSILTFTISFWVDVFFLSIQLSIIRLFMDKVEMYFVSISLCWGGGMGWTEGKCELIAGFRWYNCIP